MVYDPEMSPSSETVSPRYPHRSIRPLPTRGIHERYPPGIVAGIERPPAAPTPILFRYPTLPADDDDSSPRDGRFPGEYYPKDDRRGSLPTGAGPRLGENGRRLNRRGSLTTGLKSEAEEGNRKARNTNRSAFQAGDSENRQGSRYDQGKSAGSQPHSTTSSLDGYDPLDNSKNKKKRKIPTIADALSNGGPALSDIGSLSISGDTGSPSAEIDGVAAGSSDFSPLGTSGLAVNNKGISGPGRGTFGRLRSGRPPLKPLVNTNNWTDRNAKSRAAALWASLPNESSAPGIITSAIANAERQSVPPGQENVSLLQQQSDASKPNPQSGQFTFTCESQVPGTVKWPGSDPSAAGSSLPPYPNPNMQNLPGTAPEGSSSTANQKPAYPGKPTKESGRLSGKPHRKGRSPLDRELYLQAAERRDKAEDERRRNPGSGHDWVCEFCEYQMIFGEPPKHLIKRFERNARLERIAAEAKKRRLEQVKAKSRKGKKPAKGGSKGADTTKHQNSPVTASHDMAAADDDPGPEYTEYSPDEISDAAHFSGDSEAGYDDDVGNEYNGESSTAARHETRDGPKDIAIMAGGYWEPDKPGGHGSSTRPLQHNVNPRVAST